MVRGAPQVKVQKQRLQSVLGHPLFTNSGGALMSRPEKLRAHRVGGYADVEPVFDGKTVSVLAKPLNALHVKGWKAGVTPSADAFAFTPPTGAQKLEPDDLVDLDELPQGAPTGESK